jgi:hypothetical protein
MGRFCYTIPDDDDEGDISSHQFDAIPDCLGSSDPRPDSVISSRGQYSVGEGGPGAPILLDDEDDSHTSHRGRRRGLLWEFVSSPGEEGALTVLPRLSRNRRRSCSPEFGEVSAIRPSDVDAAEAREYRRWLPRGTWSVVLALMAVLVLHSPLLPPAPPLLTTHVKVALHHDNVPDGLDLDSAIVSRDTSQTWNQFLREHVAQCLDSVLVLCYHVPIHLGQWWIQHIKIYLSSWAASAASWKWSQAAVTSHDDEEIFLEISVSSLQRLEETLPNVIVGQDLALSMLTDALSSWYYKNIAIEAKWTADLPRPVSMDRERHLDPGTRPLVLFFVGMKGVGKSSVVRAMTNLLSPSSPSCPTNRTGSPDETTESDSKLECFRAESPDDHPALLVFTTQHYSLRAPYLDGNSAESSSAGTANLLMHHRLLVQIVNRIEQHLARFATSPTIIYFKDADKLSPTTLSWLLQTIHGHDQDHESWPNRGSGDPFSTPITTLRQNLHRYAGRRAIYVFGSRTGMRSTIKLLRQNMLSKSAVAKDVLIAIETFLNGELDDFSGSVSPPRRIELITSQPGSPSTTIHDARATCAVHVGVVPFLPLGPDELAKILQYQVNSQKILLSSNLNGPSADTPPRLAITSAAAEALLDPSRIDYLTWARLRDDDADDTEDEILTFCPTGAQELSRDGPVVLKLRSRITSCLAEREFMLDTVVVVDLWNGNDDKAVLWRCNPPHLDEECVEKSNMKNCWWNSPGFAQQNDCEQLCLFPI